MLIVTSPASHPEQTKLLIDGLLNLVLRVACDEVIRSSLRNVEWDADRILLLLVFRILEFHGCYRADALAYL